jgi:ubiquitin fusion degradation protein 1
MLPGSERPHLNYGGKIILPPSALDKLSRLHITYPMLFELFNGPKDKMTHAGVLEFVAEEGKVYLPQWMMQTLQLDVGDLVQIKSTNLADAKLVKLQAQSTAFLDISDPKAVLENAFRNFSTLTKGDVFQFFYNDQVYDMAVLEVKPESEKMGVSMIETDVEVDFAAPLGYVEPERPAKGSTGTSTPRSGIAGGGIPAGGMMHTQGGMAQAINYADIAPSSTAAASGAKAVSSNFLLGGQRLKAGGKAGTPRPSTPVPDSQGAKTPVVHKSRTNGPQPLRLPPNMLFFGYEIKPVKTIEDKLREVEEAKGPKFAGQGQTLRGGVKRKGEETPPKDESKKDEKKGPSGTGAGGKRLDGRRV